MTRHSLQNGNSMLLTNSEMQTETSKTFQRTLTLIFSSFLSLLFISMLISSSSQSQSLSVLTVTILCDQLTGLSSSERLKAQIYIPPQRFLFSYRVPSLTHSARETQMLFQLYEKGKAQRKLIQEYRPFA